MSAAVRRSTETRRTGIFFATRGGGVQRAMVNIAAGLVDMIHPVDVIMPIAAAVQRRFWMAGTMARAIASTLG